MGGNGFRIDANFELWPDFEPILEVGTGRAMAWEASGRSGDVHEAARAIAAAATRKLIAADSLLALPLDATDRPEEVVASLCCTAIAHGFSPRRLLVQLRADEGCDARSIAALAAMCGHRGIKIALDGYSAGPQGMKLLHEVRPHLVKLAPELTAHLVASAPRRRMVESVLRLARTLGITVVAPAIRRGADLSLLHTLGVTYFQSEAFETFGDEATPRHAAPRDRATGYKPSLHSV